MQVIYTILVLWPLIFLVVSHYYPIPIKLSKTKKAFGISDGSQWVMIEISFRFKSMPAQAIIDKDDALPHQSECYHGLSYCIAWLQLVQPNVHFATCSINIPQLEEGRRKTTFHKCMVLECKWVVLLMWSTVSGFWSRILIYSVFLKEMVCMYDWMPNDMVLISLKLGLR